MNREVPPEDEIAAVLDHVLIKPKDYEELAQRTIEVKRMLTALIQKLNADR